MSEIIHVDLDGFFVAVERQLDPRLASRPIVIGGQPSTHGVVVAACAEATRYGPVLKLAQRVLTDSHLPNREVVGANYFRLEGDKIKYMRTIHDETAFAPYAHSSNPKSPPAA